jgi:hypothetical protein
MKSGGKIYSDDRIPKFDRKVLDGRYVLDTRVVDKYIDGSKFSVTEVEQVLDVRSVSQIGLAVKDFGSLSRNFGESGCSKS